MLESTRLELKGIYRALRSSCLSASTAAWVRVPRKRSRKNWRDGGKGDERTRGKMWTRFFFGEDMDVCLSICPSLFSMRDIPGSCLAHIGRLIALVDCAAYVARRPCSRLLAFVE